MLLGNNRERRLSQSGREHTLDTKLGTYIRNAVWSEILGRATNVIVPLSEGVKDRPVFYCVHALSGGVTALGNLARLLGARQPFFGIQAPLDKRRWGSLPAPSSQSLITMLMLWLNSSRPVKWRWADGLLGASSHSKWHRSLEHAETTIFS